LKTTNVDLENPGAYVSIDSCFVVFRV